MLSWVPILSRNHSREVFNQLINGANDFIPLRDSERAAGAKIILNVNDEKAI